MGLYTTGAHDDLLGLGKKAAAKREVKQAAKAEVKASGGTKKEARVAGRTAVKASIPQTKVGGFLSGIFGKKAPPSDGGTSVGTGNTGIAGNLPNKNKILGKSAGHAAVAKANDKIAGATDAPASGGGGGGGGSDPAASGGDSGGDAAPDNSKKYMIYGGIGAAVLIVCFVIFKMTSK